MKNANLTIKKVEKNGKTYHNMIVSVVLKNGETCEVMVLPICKSKKTLSKLLYKLSIGLGE